MLAVLLGSGGCALTAQTPIGSVTITGTEQVSSGGVWDNGTVTATFNGVSTSIPYGQYSSPAGVASALAAMISQNCNMPVYAKATGATINFYPKGTDVINSATLSSATNNPTLFSQSSFPDNNSHLFPTTPIIVATTSASTSIYGTALTLTATFPGGGPTGSVTFYNGSTALGSGTISGTTASFTTNSLTAGTHSLTASYPGNASYHAATSGATTQTINKATPTIALSSSATGTTTYGSAVTLTAAVTPSLATGSVTFTFGSTNLGAATISSGTASITTTSLPIGSDTITAAYGGDSNDLAWSGPLQPPVPIAPLTLTIAADPQTMPYGGPIPYLTFLVTAQNSNGNSIDNTNQSVYTGMPNLTTDPPVTTTSPLGPYDIVVAIGNFAVNSNNTNYVSTPILQNGTLQIVRDKPKLSISSILPVPYGNSTNIVATVSNASNAQPNTVIPTRNVIFSIIDSNNSIDTTSDPVPLSSSGTATWNPCTDPSTCQLPTLPIGSYTVKAEYEGDTNNEPASGTQSLSMVLAPSVTMITNQNTPCAPIGFGSNPPLNFVVTVNWPPYYTPPPLAQNIAGPTGQVNLTLLPPSGGDAVTLDYAFLVGGPPQSFAVPTATFSPIAASILQAYGSADDTITAAYPGDTNYDKSNGTCTIQVEAD